MIKFGYKNKTASVIRAILSILTGGVLLYLGNGCGINIIAQVIAAFLTISGILSLIVAITKMSTSSQALNIINSILTIVIGCLIFFNASATVNILIIALGFILIGLGIFQIITLISLFLAGVFSVIPLILAIITFGIGILLTFNPGFIKDSLNWILGIALLLYGISDLISFFSHKKIERERKEAEYTTNYQNSNNSTNSNYTYSEIKDVSYEKVEEADNTEIDDQ